MNPGALPQAYVECCAFGAKDRGKGRGDPGAFQATALTLAIDSGSVSSASNIAKRIDD